MKPRVALVSVGGTESDGQVPFFKDAFESHLFLP